MTNYREEREKLIKSLEIGGSYTYNELDQAARILGLHVNGFREAHLPMLLMEERLIDETPERKFKDKTFIVMSYGLDIESKKDKIKMYNKVKKLNREKREDNEKQENKDKLRQLEQGERNEREQDREFIKNMKEGGKQNLEVMRQIINEKRQSSKQNINKMKQLREDRRNQSKQNIDKIRRLREEQKQRSNEIGDVKNLKQNFSQEFEDWATEILMNYS